MSPEMKQFFIELNQWVESGCPEDNIFYRTDGICWNSYRYFAYNNDFDTELKNILNKEFDIDYYLPFDKNIDEYHADNNKYKNKARLRFIKKMIDQ